MWNATSFYERKSSAPLSGPYDVARAIVVADSLRQMQSELSNLLTGTQFAGKVIYILMRWLVNQTPITSPMYIPLFTDHGFNHITLTRELESIPKQIVTMITGMLEKQSMGAMKAYIATNTTIGVGVKYVNETVDLVPSTSRNKVNITIAYYNKLIALYCRAHLLFAVENWDAFNTAVYCMVSRYDAMGDVGMQSANMAPVFELMRVSFDAVFECYASPLNCRYDTYCSAYPDVDTQFGSMGRFNEFSPIEGMYEANPPFTEEVIESMAMRMITLMNRATDANKALGFIVFIPGWTDAKGYMLLMGAHNYMRKLIVSPRREHAYLVGNQHNVASDKSVMVSVVDTHVFIMQTNFAASKWPVSDDTINLFKQAMLASVPSTINNSDRRRIEGRIQKKDRRDWNR